MKILVQTSGEFQLRVEDTGELVRAYGYSVVRPSPWLGQKIAGGQVEVLEKLGQDATQEDWDDTVTQSDGDLELARKAFASEYPPKETAKGQAAGADAVLPRAATGLTTSATNPANPSGQTAGLSPNEKPGAPGTEEGPGGPKDTNTGSGKPAAPHKK